MSFAATRSARFRGITGWSGIGRAQLDAEAHEKLAGDLLAVLRRIVTQDPDSDGGSCNRYREHQ